MAAASERPIRVPILAQLENVRAPVLNQRTLRG
jgi:hypothetical protein